jgi:hypothetical protein
LQKGVKCKFPGGKFQQTKRPFSENQKRPVTEEISALIKEIRAKQHYFKAKKQKNYYQIAPKSLIQTSALD